MPAFAGHTTVHDPLESHGSRCSAVAMAQWPMGEEAWPCAPSALEPVLCALRSTVQPLVLAAGPSNQIGIDPVEERTQLRPIEATVVGDPAAKGRIVHRSQIFQGLVTALMQRPAADLAPDAHARCRAHRRQKAMRDDALAPHPPHRLAGSKLKAQKVEADLGIVASPIGVLAVDDLRLLGV